MIELIFLMATIMLVLTIKLAWVATPVLLICKLIGVGAVTWTMISISAAVAVIGVLFLATVTILLD